MRGPLRRPLLVGVLSCGLGLALEVLQLPARVSDPLGVLVWTSMVLAAAMAGGRIGAVLLRAAASRERAGSVLQPQTLGAFEVLLRVLVVAAAAYCMFLVWGVELEAWLATVGVVGLSIAFAAKDVLGDLFSGIMIAIDRPFAVGDWVVLDHATLRLRGEVIQIGIRSTRILTPDGAQIPVPNGMIGNRTLINETRGRHRRQRVRVPFVVGFGVDVDHVRSLVLAASEGASAVLEQPDATPTVRLRRLGARGLEFELWVWIEDPQVREAVIDELTTNIYLRLTAAGIVPAPPSREVRVRDDPSRPQSSTSSRAIGSPNSR